MKKFFISLLCMLPLSLFAQDKDGHMLTTLWKSYDSAVKADKPKTQVSVLEQIIDESFQKKLPWDYYDAAKKKVDVVSSMNWKEYDNQKTELNKAVKKYNLPVMTFYHERSVNFVDTSEAELKKGYNPEFYKHESYILSTIYAQCILDNLKNDYDYAIWVFQEHLYLKAASNFSGRYPMYELLSFRMCKTERDYENFVRAYKSKDVSLLGREQLLSYKYQKLSRDKNSTSADYKKLADECRQFIKDRKASKEQSLVSGCTYPDKLLERLEEKALSISVANDIATIIFVNVDKASLSIKKDGKKVFEKTVVNPKNSFVLPDTVKVSIPLRDDGVYSAKISSGKVQREEKYRRFNASIAMKCDSEGQAIYATDFRTGEPLGTMEVYYVDKNDKEDHVSVDCSNGFVYLPKNFTEKINILNRADAHVRKVMPDGHIVLSQDIRVPSEPYRSTPYEATYCKLITDRSAFNPGETVHFKIIAYKRGADNVYETLPAGGEYTAKLFDTQKKEISKKEFRLNEFGSADGSFVLERSERNGRYLLQIYNSKSSSVASTYLTVDDFVLPTFALTWDKDTREYMPGDKVRIGGSIKSYSSHSLSSADVTYSVSGSDKTQEGKVLVGPDGHFELEFDTRTSSYQYYGITLKVTDGTGETHTFSRSLYVCDSYSFDTKILNSVPSKFSFSNNAPDLASVVTQDKVRVICSAVPYPNMVLNYELMEGDNVVGRGEFSLGSEFEVLVPEKSKTYVLKTNYVFYDDTGKGHNGSNKTALVRIDPGDTTLNLPGVTSLFVNLPGDDPAVMIGCTEGPCYIVAELYDSNNKVLEKAFVHLDGEKGKPGSLTTVSWPFKSEYTDEVEIKVLYFKNERSFTFDVNKKRPEAQKYVLPLEFTRFSDRTGPGQKCSFLIKTAPNIECAATVYDKALETISPNRWGRVSKYEYSQSPNVSYSTCCGICFIEEDIKDYILYRAGAGKKSVAYDAMVAEAAPVAEASMNSSEESSVNGEEENVRTDLAPFICWEPALRSDDQGQIELNFKNSDRLSTFVVQLFAHDKQMNNSVLYKEMVVTVPVKVSVAEPQYLYSGDCYVARVEVSNALDEKVDGVLAVEAGKTSKKYKMSLGSGASQAVTLQLPAVSDDPVLLKASFVPDKKSYGSDAVQVKIPVKAAVQEIVESHSAIVLDGQNLDAIKKSLRAEFQNSGQISEEEQTKTIMDMVKEALPGKFQPSSKDVLSQSEALYAMTLASSLGVSVDMSSRARFITTILSCVNGDGGIGWFPGMSSSPIVTSTILQRLASLEKRGLSVSELDGISRAAILYLDDCQFDSRGVRPSWCGGLTMAQYAYTRSLYPDVPYRVDIPREFKKDLKEYLVPSDERGLNGQILSKARRLLTLNALSSEDGEKLASHWGIILSSKIQKSAQADTESLLEYAQPHKSGGVYYPNAVMPWRGLQESELYAHSLLCDLLSPSDVSEGVRLWIMVQKETQQWKDDPAYVEAVASVMDATEETKQTKVTIITRKFVKKFSDVKAAGNGFTLKCRYIRENGEELKNGEALTLGERIRAEYKIWNEENRSFVRLCVPRPAAMRPVKQLSGMYGWWVTPLRINGWVTFSPQGYRSVLTDTTEYWFDAYPEEKTTVSEDLYVTQQGRFYTPVATIESLYSPHYRANDAGRPMLEVK